MNPNLLIPTTLFGIAVFAAIVIHNGIKSRSNAVRRAWSDVLAYERQKQQVLNKLEQAVASYKDFESSLLIGITRLRATLGSLNNEPDTVALAEVERTSTEVLRNLRVAVEAYPDLKAAAAVRDFIAQLTSLQREVTAALAIFNRNVELFNTGLEVIPNSLVNATITRARRVAPFSDSSASAAFEYQPEL